MPTPCDACGREVPIAGGIGDFWTLSPTETRGMVLELADGTEHFLCFSCMEDLPDDREPGAEDVTALERDRDRE